MKKYLVVATESELSLPWAMINEHRETIVTGIGGTNVIRSLKDLPRDSEILNVGFCGSNRFPAGAVVWVKNCRLWHPNVDFAEQTFSLEASGDVLCLTAGDFVLDGTELPARAVVDMELAYILALGFVKVRSVKYVSDNLNLTQYEESAKGLSHAI